MKRVNQRIMGDSFAAKHFADPSADYRPAPLWVWNDELTPRRVRQQLRELHRVGMGGAFVHPRPGLISEYLGPDWWKCFAAALDEADKLGMKLQIYDENSYPSGFAGGHVPAQLPHTVATGVAMRKLSAEEALPKIPSGGGGPLYAAVEWQGGKFVFEKAPGEARAWHGGFAYVDLLRRETTEKFIEVTHQEYYRRFKKHFGKTLAFAFFDEPVCGYCSIYSQPVIIPLSLWFAAKFRERKGYDIVPEVPKLFLDLPDYQKVRFDYYELMHQLFVENWAIPMRDWCRQHRISVTGHYFEHTWLQPYLAGTPDAMAMYEWMDMPGIDMLECRIGRKGGEKSIGHAPSLLLMTIRELLSAANQLGQKRTLCETYGAGGYDSTFEDYKRLGDWLYVHGVNYQNQHLSFMTLRGARKRDHPQTFSEHAAWWPHYKTLNDYFGRLSLVLSQGRMRQRVLLLHPTTSGWVEANPINQSEKIKPLHAAYPDLVQALCDRLWDFDLGDEFIMENHGRVAGKALRVGRQRYEVVVVPAGIRNLRSATAVLLEQFTKNGGRVLLLGDPPKLVDGKPSDRVTKLAPRWSRLTGNAALDQSLAQTIGRQVRFEGVAEWPVNVHVMRRELGVKKVGYFFNNMSQQRVALKAWIQERGVLERWDAITGEITPLASDGSLDLDLAHCESALFVIHTGRRNKVLVRPRVGEAGQIALELQSIRAHDSNVLVLDYCDANFGGVELRAAHHGAANMAIARAHGFERPVWDGAVQYKRSLLDQDHFWKTSGFEAEFHFEVEAMPAHVELALECPSLYQIAVNGRPVAGARGRRWLDEWIRLVDITRFVRRGRNRATIRARPYRIRMELEPIYLRGDFSLEPSEKGFRLVAARSLSLGSWRKQGMPFYSDAVTYEFRCQLPRTGRRHVLRLGDWAGAVASVNVNHQEAGIIGWPSACTPQGGYELDVTHCLRQGNNLIRLTVYGTPKNVLGPFHCHPGVEGGSSWRTKLPPRRTAWPAMWFAAPQEGPPPGVQYDQIDYGLFTQPELISES